jgi:hypothetical protein
MDRVDAQKAFRKPSALIEINIGIGAVAGRRRFESTEAVDRFPTSPSSRHVLSLRIG